MVSDNTIAVLLVEDNPADVVLLMELLQESDAECWQVTSVKRLSAALEQLSKTGFDVILLDLSLPDSQGLDTIAQVQAAVPYLPIVVLTGLQDKTIARQAVAQGAQDYLVKAQLSVELLIKTVNYAIERTQILRRLQESENCFRGVFNQTFQFMSLLSSDGVVLDINQTTREVGGFQDEVVINTFIWEAPYWQSSEQSKRWLETAVLRAAQGETIQSELQSCTSDQIPLWLDFSIKPLKNSKGDINLLIAEGRDISKLKRAEAEIRRSLEKEQELSLMKNKFISMISHEFRSPMAIISSAIDLLEDNEISEDDKSKFYQKMRNCIDQTLQLIDEVLLFGRATGRVELEHSPLELEKYCSEIVETFQLTTGREHQIIYVCEGTSVQVGMDPFLLKQIIDNLLSNAIKYSPKSGMIRFTLSLQSNQAIFCIQDWGIGIPQQDQAQLFTAFKRAGNVYKIQGTGLGLAIVKQCVDLLHGKIDVESQEGCGTTFTVTLPLSLAET